MTFYGDSPFSGYSSFNLRREMQQYDGLHRLQEIIMLEKLHIFGVFLSASYDVNPGEHADTLVQMIKASKCAPYFKAAHYRGGEL